MPLTRFLCCLIAIVVATPANAQRDDTASRHAWVVLPQAGDAVTTSEAVEGTADEAEQTGSILLHIPPRVPVGIAGPAPDLRVARIARLSRTPEWLVPVAEQVYCIMPAEEDGVHRVGRSRVFPRGLRDLWGADPARRLEVLPALEGEVLAVATDGEAPLALVRSGGTLGVQRLGTDGWSAASPVIDAQPFAKAGLVWSGGGPAVLLLRESGIERLVLDGDSWLPGTIDAPPGFDPEVIDIAGAFRGELIVIEPEGESGFRVLSINDRAVVPLGSVESGPYDAVAIIGDPGRLVLVSQSEESVEAETTLPTPGVSRRAVLMVEFSLVTGRTLASGPASASSPVSRGEFQALAILLFAMMILVLVVVVRPTPTSAEPVLPPGTAIASPGRRVLATFIDMVPAVIIASWLLGLSVAETLGPIALPITGSVDIVPLVFVLAIAATHSAVGEMLSGRSIGKMFVGTFVARVDPLPGVSPVPGQFRPPTPGGAILRNLLKWFLFPATAIVLSDPSGRHRGDLIARSAVLMPVPDAA